MVEQSRSRQKGVALLAALILMLALILTLGNIFYRHQIDVSQAVTMLHGEQALLMAFSAENWARDLLSSEQDDRDVDSLDEQWAVAVPLLPMDDGFVRGCLVDLQSRLNLNNLGTYTSERWQEEMSPNGNGVAKTLMQLLAQLQLNADPGRVAAIVDWVDDNQEPINQWGVEQPSYDYLSPPRMVANAEMVEVAELAAISGYDLPTMQYLLPWLATLPGETTININTAPAQVLLALGGDQAEQFAELVLDARPFADMSDFYAVIRTGFNLDEQQVRLRWPEQLVGVTSDYFLLNLEVNLGDAVIEVRSTLGRRGADLAVVIQREVTAIPAIIPDESQLAAVPLCPLPKEERI